MLNGCGMRGGVDVNHFSVKIDVVFIFGIFHRVGCVGRIFPSKVVISEFEDQGLPVLICPISSVLLGVMVLVDTSSGIHVRSDRKYR